MALYTISDLHLSTLDSTNKSMDVFGHRWEGYIKKLEANWRRLITDDDTVVIPGDISWALSLEEATADLRFIDSLPGKKILGKGNHDFWWTTMKKHREHFENHAITSISFLFNNAIETDNFIIAGTRGWFWEEKTSDAKNNVNFEKLTARENLRLKTSLSAAKAIKEKSCKEILAFMHFPPVWNGTVADEIYKTLCEFSVKRVFFGHIHGNYTVPAKFDYNGIEMHLISADYLDFIPKIIVND